MINKYTFLALAAMASTASASYIIVGSGISVGGTDYSGNALSGVNLGTFSTSDTLLLDGSSTTDIYTATVNDGGAVPAGAQNANNYIHSPNGDGASMVIKINGATVSTQQLTLSTDPGSDKGTFGWGNVANFAELDLIALAGNTAGTYDLSYEIAYTFTNWAPGNVQVTGQSHSPMTGVASFTVVPEPSSTALLGLGGLALILRRRK